MAKVKHSGKHMKQKPKFTGKQTKGKDNKHFKDKNTKFSRKQTNDKDNKHFKDKNAKFTGKPTNDNKNFKDQNAKPWKKRKSPNRPKKPDDEESDFEEVDVNTSAKTIEKVESDSESEQLDTRKLVQQQNRKNKKSGGFQSMGLSFPVFKGITRKGYKIPTPIQRKTIPMIMDGKDVVAMARTGSGKTAAFLVPMFEKLKRHLTTGARALILAPTRELALQTLKFTKELGKFTGLRAAVILGGDSMDQQFAAIHENPDIIIATPGRFMHVLVEMELKMKSVEYLVFDEADRLFELGFQESMREILQRVPESRQTLLFSATLPKLLVEFAKAGLHDPTLIRLDVETKLSENLRLAFIQCQTDNKTAVLLHLLRNVIKANEQTLVFVATRHHVDYLNLILQEAGYPCSYSYSSLDQTARKINVAKFRNKKTMILLVTDLAARGIDIPLLDNVINYNFPAKSKLFVHRVGRVARAGRLGAAYSLVAPDEIAYVLDLHLFLGRPLRQVLANEKVPEGEDGLYGLVPQSVLDAEQERLKHWAGIFDISSMEKVIANAYRQYLKSRPAPAHESIKRCRELAGCQLGYHPMFGSVSADIEEERNKLILSMRSFKPKGTIFEINSKKKSAGFGIMKHKRQYHEDVIRRNADLQQERTTQLAPCQEVTYTPGEEEEIHAAFSTVVAPKPSKSTSVYEPKKKKRKRTLNIKDEENYLHYSSKDHQSEKGLSMESTFDQQAEGATLDLTGDDAEKLRNQRKILRWDRKKKKFVQEEGFEPQKKKILTESGQWIAATYKKNIYKDWLERSKVADRDDDDDESPALHTNIRGNKGRGGAGIKKTKGSSNEKVRGARRELKPKEQVVKERRKKDTMKAFMKQREVKHQSKKRKKK